MLTVSSRTERATEVTANHVAHVPRGGSSARGRTSVAAPNIWTAAPSRASAGLL